jgi:DHA1 family bicyclomycin/chloramphenicol resistance-like MFS transporter
VTSVGAAPERVAPRVLSNAEYRAFIGLAMASAAVSIDLVLPAFARIRRDFDLPPGSAATAGLITVFFLGLACGPIPFGLLSDRYGRRVVLRLSCVLFVAGALAAALAPSLALIKLARFVWGLGGAGLRVTTMAMIRDRYEGADMAREMSFAMTVFILVPVFAPLVGAGVIRVVPWRGAFVVCALFAVGIGLWSLRISVNHRFRTLSSRLSRNRE